MRPPFTLLAGNRQSPEKSRRATKDDGSNNNKKASSTSTPSNKEQLSNQCHAASPARPPAAPASPSVFTRSPGEAADTFSSTAYILNNMMDVDTEQDIEQDNLLSAPAETVDMRADDLGSTNNNIFASETRAAKTPQSSRKALQVKTMGDHVELRIVQQEDAILPEHVPLPPSSPLKQQQSSPIKRRSLPGSAVDGEHVGDVLANAPFNQDDVTEQAAAIPLPPSPEKPRTGVSQDASILESPSEHCVAAEVANAAENGKELYLSLEQTKVNGS